MLNEMIVSKVVFNEVDKIALEVALEHYARNTSELKGVIKKDGKIFIIKDGKSFELSEATIKNQIEKALIGKTILEVNKKIELLNLAKSSGLLDKIELSIDSTEEIELF